MTAPVAAAAALLDPPRLRAQLELFVEHFTARSDRDVLLVFLPPHMRGPAASWGFGMSRQFIELHALGTRWFSDGVAAVDSGLRVSGFRPNGSIALDALVSRPASAERVPVERGPVTWLGHVMVATAYVRLVEALHGECSWADSGPRAPVLARASGRVVAVVMPMARKVVKHG